jgi:hypothetical protein
MMPQPLARVIVLWRTRASLVPWPQISIPLPTEFIRLLITTAPKVPRLPPGDEPMNTARPGTLRNSLLVTPTRRLSSATTPACVPSTVKP